MPFQIIRNDITKVKADAIVNTANPHPVIGGGTDSAIYKAAGEKKLLKEREKIGEIAPGEAVFTKAFALKAKYIIHTVGPAWDGGDQGEFDTLRSCYDKSLYLAKQLKCESIAFPLISTGVYRFPRAEALRIAVSAFSDFLKDNEMEITLVVFDRDSFVLSGKIFSGVDTFIEENAVSEQLSKEYRIGSVASAGSVDGLRDATWRRRRRDATSSADQGAYTADATEDGFEDTGFAEEFADGAAFGDLAAGVPQALAASRKPESLQDRVAHISDTWQESLLHMIDQRELKDSDVYKRANVDRKLFSKIRKNAKYQPKKSTAVAFALALELDLDETKDFLGRAGYALSPSSVFDLIIAYFIEQKVYDSYTINLALFEHDQPLLGE